MFRIFFTFIAVAIFVQAVAGQETETDWKQHVIPARERTFDFKTVARGATPEHQFILRNPLQEPLRVGGITSSCTCVTLDFDREKLLLDTYEEMIVTARLRGDMFDGQRNATITVVIDKPQRTEIQLHVRGEIRTDLMISPVNFIDFGNIELGKGQTRSLTVTYRGSNTRWWLVDAKSENEFIHAEIVHDAERSGVGVKVFRVNVSIDPSAPHGSINTHLILMSNDAATRREIPISLRATVGTMIRVIPSPLFLGVLPPGKASPQRHVWLLGTKPFRITKIECDNPAIDIPLVFSNDDPPQIRHHVPILYTNPIEGNGAPQEGVMRATIRVTTDIPGVTSMFYVTASVRDMEEEK
jgi:hypothetical protein